MKVLPDAFFACCNRRNMNSQSYEIWDSYLENYFKPRRRVLNETENWKTPHHYVLHMYVSVLASNLWVIMPLWSCWLLNRMNWSKDDMRARLDETGCLLVMTCYAFLSTVQCCLRPLWKISKSMGFIRLNSSLQEFEKPQLRLLKLMASSRINFIR